MSDKHTFTVTPEQAMGLLFLLGGRHQHLGLAPHVVNALGEVELQIKEALYPPVLEVSPAPAEEPPATGKRARG